MYCRSTSRPFLAKMPDSRATHSDRLSAIRLLYATPIFLAGPAVGGGAAVGGAGWAAGAHAANTMPSPIRNGTNGRGMTLTGYKFSQWHARCTALPDGGPPCTDPEHHRTARRWLAPRYWSGCCSARAQAAERLLPRRRPAPRRRRPRPRPPQL